MSVRLRLALLALTAAMVAAFVVAGLQIAIPKPPPARVTPVPPAHEPLTGHLALIVVDGLRYDLATDPQIMPHFARAMRQRTSGEIWAGQITMTSGALLAYMAGQYGDLDQIVFNETARQTRFDHLLAAAHERGLRAAATGDWAWFRFFGDTWTLTHPDPEGVSMATDYDDEIFAAAAEFAAHRPSLLVAHFVTPDHQGHVHGITSPAYRRYLGRFDGKLHRFLTELPSDFTVFVTSDHGAQDTGKHGTNTPIERRCPIYAYGPGIRPGVHGSTPLAQADLAATFAHLLGLRSPVHGVGHVLAPWLDRPATIQAEVACRELERIGRFAAATLGAAAYPDRLVAEACRPGEPETRLVAARAASERLATVIEQVEPVESKHMWWMLAGAALGALLLGLLWRGGSLLRGLRRFAPALPVAVALLIVGVVLTRQLERLPGTWPNRIRIPLMIAANAALLVATLRARAFGRLVDRHAPWLATAIVGALVATYTSYTQPQAYIVAALTALILVVPALRHHLADAGAGRAPIASYRAVLALALVALIHPAGFAQSGLVPWSLARSPTVTRYVVVGLLALFVIERLLRRRQELAGWGQRTLVAATTALLLMAPWLRGSEPPVRAMALWLLPPIVGIALWRRGHRTAGELLLLTSYTMVARDLEFLFLLPTVLIAETVGEVMGTMARRDGSAPRHAAVVGIVAFLFALTYVQRIGIQLGLDFTHFDWAAGTFGGDSVPILRIGSAITYKHSLARGAIVALVLIALPGAYRRPTAYGLLLVELGRTVVLMSMLLFCRQSFWTALRVMSDLPHALMGVGVAAIACTLVLGPIRLPAPGSRSGATTP